MKSIIKKRNKRTVKTKQKLESNGLRGKKNTNLLKQAPLGVGNHYPFVKAVEVGLVTQNFMLIVIIMRTLMIIMRTINFFLLCIVN